MGAATRNQIENKESTKVKNKTLFIIGLATVLASANQASQEPLALSIQEVVGQILGGVRISP